MRYFSIKGMPFCWGGLFSAHRKQGRSSIALWSMIATVDTILAGLYCTVTWNSSPQENAFSLILSRWSIAFLNCGHSSCCMENKLFISSERFIRCRFNKTKIRIFSFPGQGSVEKWNFQKIIALLFGYQLFL